MTLLRRLGTAVAGAAVLVVVCVAAPAALASLAAFVWPHAWTWSAVGPGRAGVLGADALGWLAWAVYVVGLAADVLALVRQGDRSVPVGGAVRTRAAGWVAGLVLLVLPAAAVVGAATTGGASAVVVAPVAVSVASSASSVPATARITLPVSGLSREDPPGPPAPASADAGSAGTVQTAQSPVGTVYTVVAGDCLSTIAEHFYGDQGAWSEIWQANMDRVMPDGRRFTDPNLIYGGWTLVLPGVAAAPVPIPAPTATSTPAPAAAAPAARTPAPAPATTVTPSAPAPVAPTTRPAGTGREDHQVGAGTAARQRHPSEAVPVEHVHWVPETAALGVSTVVAAALTRRIRRGRAKARAARGDGDLVVDPAPADVVLEARTAPFRGAPVLDWLELANRHLTAALRDEGLDGAGEPDVPPVHLVRAGPDGVELRLGRPVHWAPGAFVLVEDGAGWLLPSDADREALSVVASGELAWLPLLVPVGDGPDGTYLLHLEAGAAVPVEGPAADAMLRTWRAAAESWPWAEQVAVADDTEPVSAERLAGCFEGQASVDARGTVLYLGDPADLSATARWTCASAGPHVDHGADPYRRRVVVTNERAVMEPWGIEVRPCLLDAGAGDALGNVLDEQSLLPDPLPDHELGDTALTTRIDGTVPEPGAIEVRLLTFTPELVGLARPLPTDKRVRITELVAWLALRGDRGTTSAAILDHGIAGATAAKTVYNMVSAARTALGHDADGAPRLRSDRSTGVYSVSPEVTVDVVRFEALVGAGSAAADEHEAAALCRMALELIEDTPVGNGSGRYGWWASAWEARVGRLAVKAARRLAELARVSVVDLDTARWAIGRARLAAADEEELVRVGMALDAWAGGEGGQGRVDVAWEDAVRRAEERDPGSAPTEATEAVYAAIRRGWLADDPPPQR